MQFLAENTTTTGTPGAVELKGESPPMSVQAIGSTTAGAGAATINVDVSNDGVNFINAGTITLTLGTTVTSDGFTIASNWKFARAYVVSISGTGAAASVMVA